MYTNILVPTDGSELAGKAVQHGIALAKRIGARVTVLTVLPPFRTITTDPQMIEDTPAQYKVRMQKHAEKILDAVATQAAGVACETIQVEHEHPYQAIIDTADSKESSWRRMAATAFLRSSSAARRSRSSRIARSRC